MRSWTRNLLLSAGAALAIGTAPAQAQSQTTNPCLTRTLEDECIDYVQTMHIDINTDYAPIELFGIESEVNDVNNNNVYDESHKLAVMRARLRGEEGAFMNGHGAAVALNERGQTVEASTGYDQMVLLAPAGIKLWSDITPGDMHASYRLRASDAEGNDLTHLFKSSVHQVWASQTESGTGITNPLKTISFDPKTIYHAADDDTFVHTIRFTVEKDGCAPYVYDMYLHPEPPKPLKEQDITLMLENLEFDFPTATVQDVIPGPERPVYVKTPAELEIHAGPYTHTGAKSITSPSQTQRYSTTSQGIEASAEIDGPAHIELRGRVGFSGKRDGESCNLNCGPGDFDELALSANAYVPVFETLGLGLEASHTQTQAWDEYSRDITRQHSSSLFFGPGAYHTFNTPQFSGNAYGGIQVGAGLLSDGDYKASQLAFTGAQAAAGGEIDVGPFQVDMNGFVRRGFTLNGIVDNQHARGSNLWQTGFNTQATYQLIDPITLGVLTEFNYSQYYIQPIQAIDPHVREHNWYIGATIGVDLDGF